MKILVAEDDEDSRLFLEKLLVAKGFDVMTAVNGKEALEHLSNFQADLIISDILMPVMDGYLLCRKVKNDARFKNIPFIFYTATYTGERDRQFGRSLGACRYILKPVESAVLLAEIDQVLAESSDGSLVDQINPAPDDPKIDKQYSAVLGRKLDKKISVLAKEKKKLKQSKQQYRQLVESLQDDYFCYSHGIDGVFTYISPSIQKILGYSPQEFQSHYSKYLTSNPINKGVARHTELSIMGKQQPAYEVEIFHRSGEIHRLEVTEIPLFDESGTVVAVDGIAHDVTARREADQTFQSLVESIAGHTGQELFDTVVRGLCEMFNCQCAILGEYNGSIVQTIAMELDGQIVEEYTYELAGSPCENVKKMGYCYFPEKICELFPDDIVLRDMAAAGYVGIPIRNEERKSVGILCAVSRGKLVLPDRAEGIMNILEARCAAEIERVRSDEALRKSQEHLIQAQKLEAIGTLAGGIAHDFNNILTAIYGYTELAKMNSTGHDSVQNDLDHVLEAALRAKKLVHQILAFSRKGEHEKQILQIAPLVKEALKMLRSSLPSTIVIKENIVSQAVVLADPTQIHQVIMNLCTNAHHAMREMGGILTVSLEERCLSDEHMPHIDLEPGKYLLLEVSDTGMGMNAATKDKIFEPYFTTKKEGEGTGLGLAVVHGIVQECSGGINACSEEGQGTTFQVYLPIIEGEVADYTPCQDEVQLLGGRERIMFVDDEQTIVELYKKILESHGYTVNTFTNGVQAWQELRQTPNRYDLVVTDMTMPYMTGTQLSQKIIEIRPELPIILCTGYSELINREKALAMGIAGYCNKPLTTAKLLSTIRNALQEN